MTIWRSKRFRDILGYGIGVLILACILLALRKDAHALNGFDVLHNGPALAISLAAGFAASVLSAWSWYAALNALDARCSFRTASHIWYTSMAARYIPGTIPGVALRIYLAVEAGVSRPVAATATALDWVCWLTSAMLAAVLTAPAWARHGSMLLHSRSMSTATQCGVIGAALLVGLLLLHPRVVGFLIRKAARRVGSEEGPSLSYRRILALLPIYLAKWPFYGIAVAAFLRTSTAHGGAGAWIAALPIATAAFAVGWAAGFVSPFAPGGIGVREAVIVAALAGTSNGDSLLAAAILSRLTTTLAELVCWGWAALDRGVRAEQGNARSNPESPAAQQSLDTRSVAE